MANYRKLIKFTYLNQYLFLMIILNLYENILLDLNMNYMEVNIKLSLNF